MCSSALAIALGAITVIGVVLIFYMFARLLRSEGSYVQCVDISAVSDLSEAEFCLWLTREIGVAAIPLSAFYGNGFDQRVVRFCFAKKDETLLAALDRLARL